MRTFICFWVLFQYMGLMATDLDIPDSDPVSVQERNTWIRDMENRGGEELSLQENGNALKRSRHDLISDKLPQTWDEGIPLGNGMLGALIWEKEGKLRLSLDRADLWDLRPMDNLDFPEWKYQWVVDQWENNTYEEVQKRLDVPYDKRPAPTKIPGGALEFDLISFGKMDSLRLYLRDAVCEVSWAGGQQMQSFVQADEHAGWFRFEGVPSDFVPSLIPPNYQDASIKEGEINSLSGQSLQRLGYKQGKVIQDGNSLSYTQEGWGGFFYQIQVEWERIGSQLTGVWSISSDYPDWEKTDLASVRVARAKQMGMKASLAQHQTWWQKFWQQSSLRLPDTLLETQWYREMYKWGSVARSDGPPISLQAVWTADNGKIPPWKGDFHHDLNTQLSYWPAYSGNHLDLEEGFVNWLWKYKDTFKEYTQSYYETGGLNVPGVTTLTGAPMGGWIQYSLGPTVSAWLGQHFYLHWRYTKDQDFLENKAYPWITEVATYLDEVSVQNGQGMRKLPLSSSPEIFNNSREAWFEETTNFDLALIRWTFEKAAELARELDHETEAKKWQQILGEWPDYSIDEKEGLMFAKNTPYHESHRHLSHLMAIHPLGLIDWSKGENDREIIRHTIANLDSIGAGAWVGYSYSWLGNVKARALDGQGAAEALRIFAEAFCLPNSFHVNGDQTGKGYSNFTYRPFTLEGNFAFAAGIQEMLIQSHTGIIRIFPAVPDDWEDIEFDQLRSEGAFLVSAKKEKGRVEIVEIKALKGGILRLQNPFPSRKIDCSLDFIIDEDNVIHINTHPEDNIVLRINE